MKNLIRNVADNLPLIAPYAVKSGDPFMVGSFFAVASTDADAGAPVEGVTEGEYALPKTAGQAWTVGMKLYWDATNRVLTSTAGSNPHVALATAGAASAATSGAAKLVYAA